MCECNEGWEGPTCNKSVTYTMTYDLSDIVVTQHTDPALLVFSFPVKTRAPFYMLDTPSFLSGNLSMIASQPVMGVNDCGYTVSKQTLFFLANNASVIAWLKDREGAYTALTGFLFGSPTSLGYLVPESLWSVSISGWYDTFPTVGDVVPGTLANFTLITPQSNTSAPVPAGIPVMYLVQQSQTGNDIESVQFTALTITAQENNYTTVVYTSLFSEDFANLTAPPYLVTFVPDLDLILAYPGIETNGTLVTFCYTIQFTINFEQTLSPGKRSAGYSEGDIITGRATYNTTLPLVPTSSPTPVNPGGGAITGDAIFGIVIGEVVAVFLVIFLAFFFSRGR